MGRIRSNSRKEQRIREARVGERVAGVLRRCQMDLVRRSWVGWREFVAVRRFQRSEGLIQAQTRDREQDMRETRMRSARFNNVSRSTFALSLAQTRTGTLSSLSSDLSALCSCEYPTRG